MSTAELLAEYNATTGKSTTKFASRAAGEKAVQKLRDTTARDADSGSSVTGYKIHEYHNCPHCGIHLSNGVIEHGDEVGEKILKLKEFQFECMACGSEFGPALKKTTKSITRSTSISESWNDQVVAEKRARRDAVEVNGVQYRSVAQAFQKLNLPMSKHIQFRMTLKETGEVDIVAGTKTYTFKLVKKG